MSIAGGKEDRAAAKHAGACLPAKPPGPLPACLSACRVPEALIPPAGARVMSLQDGASKMSKSAESDLSRVNLLDPPDLVVQKVKVGCRPPALLSNATLPSPLRTPEKPDDCSWLPLPCLVPT
jgi:tryptophanyl-tRNA synthetase